MKPELAFRLAQGIQLLHLDNADNYTNTSLATTTGLSVSTLRRNRDIVKLLDVALRISDYEEIQ